MAKVLRTVLITGIFLFCGMFILRILLAEYYPASVKTVLENEVLSSAYDGVLPPDAFTQDPVTPYDDKDRAHFFHKYLAVIPDAKQLQITLRYNDSTLEDIKNDFSLDALPDGEDARFSFYLRDEQGALYPCSLASYEHFLIYNYRRLVFDNVDTQTTGMIYLDVYFGEADPETDVPYGSMLIFVGEKATKDIQLPSIK